jgi:putative membrane protein
MNTKQKKILKSFITARIKIRDFRTNLFIAYYTSSSIILDRCYVSVCYPKTFCFSSPVGIVFAVSGKRLMNTKEDLKDRRGGGPADHLANERTFLAWIRTSIALMGFGFVIVKFALFIRQISVALGNKVMIPAKGNSAIIGVIMVALGAIMATLAFFRYLGIEKQLNNNSFFPSKWLSAIVTASIVIGSILLVLYLIPNIK